MTGFGGSQINSENVWLVLTVAPEIIFQNDCFGQIAVIEVSLPSDLIKLYTWNLSD
jgi:hypothetical protein